MHRCELLQCGNCVFVDADGPLAAPGTGRLEARVGIEGRDLEARSDGGLDKMTPIERIAVLVERALFDIHAQRPGTDSHEGATV